MKSLRLHTTLKYYLYHQQIFTDSLRKFLKLNSYNLRETRITNVNDIATPSVFNAILNVRKHQQILLYTKCLLIYLFLLYIIT